MGTNRQRNLQAWTIVGTLILIAGYAIFFSIPIMLRATYSGFTGHMSQHQFVITHVRAQSPAASAGIQVGDRILGFNHQDIDFLDHHYRRDTGHFLELISRTPDELVMIDIKRGDQRLTLTMPPVRAIQGLGLVSFGLRITFALLIGSLACFFAFSKRRDTSGTVLAFCMCFALLAFLSGARFTQSFVGPYLGQMSSTEFEIVSSVSVLATTLLLGSLLWFILVFPDGWKGHRLVPLLVYGLPVCIIGALFFSVSGSVSQRFSTIYPARLWLTTAYLVLCSVLILRTYLTCSSVLERTRIRLVGMTILFVSGFSLAFWVIPRWVLNRPLIVNIDWMFIPYSLVPLAIIVSIHKHHLFGIPGIARRRLRILEKQLLHEKRLVSKKDERISHLAQEIALLQSELEEHLQHELPKSQLDYPLSNRYQKLEIAHPYLKVLRDEKLIGVHPCWEQIMEQVVMAAKINRSVFIRGESGTGKTDIARAIHQLGPRREKVYKEVSCAQFEHGDPAFALGRFFGIGRDHGMTNISKEGRQGLLQECDGGTLFLDDVDRLPLHVQDLLLYPLEGKPFEPGIGVGGPHQVDVKFMFASNQDLEQMADEGRFRGDILARMGTRIEIPPLRERAEDIPVLIDFFRPRICEELSHEVTVISPKAMQLLCACSYEGGNVRDLKRELETAIGRALLQEDHLLRAGYLSQRLQTGHREVRPKPQAPMVEEQVPAGELVSLPDTNISKELKVLRQFHFRIKESEVALGLSHKSRTLSNHLRGICLDALTRNNWDLSRAAEAVVGENHADDIQRVRKKMIRFLERTRLNIAQDKEALLFNNLATNYHPALQATIEWCKLEGRDGG